MKWFWILGVLLGAGGPVRAQMDSVVICLEKARRGPKIRYAWNMPARSNILYGLRLSVVIGLKSL